MLDLSFTSVPIISPQLLRFYLDGDLNHIYYKTELASRVIKFIENADYSSFLLDGEKLTTCAEYQEIGKSEIYTSNGTIKEIYLKDTKNCTDYLVWIETNTQKVVAFKLDRPHIFLPLTHRSNIRERYLGTSSIDTGDLGWEFTTSNGFLNRTFFQYGNEYYVLEWRNVLLSNLQIFEMERHAKVTLSSLQLDYDLVRERLMNFELELPIKIDRCRISGDINLVSLEKTGVELIPKQTVTQISEIIIDELLGNTNNQPTPTPSDNTSRTISQSRSVGETKPGYMLPTVSSGHRRANLGLRLKKPITGTNSRIQTPTSVSSKAFPNTITKPIRPKQEGPSKKPNFNLVKRSSLRTGVRP